jgi:hypothetical protein
MEAISAFDQSIDEGLLCHPNLAAMACALSIEVSARLRNPVSPARR